MSSTKPKSSPIDILNAKQCRVNHGLKKRIRDMELQKKSKRIMVRIWKKL